MFARTTVLLKFSVFICYACSVDFYSLVEREKKPNRSPESFQISKVTCTLSLFSLSLTVVWSGNIFSSVAIFLIIALGTSGYFSIVMIFWLHNFKKIIASFFFGYIVLNLKFLLFTSFPSLLSKWFALAAQIYLNRDSLKIVSVLICIEGGKMRIINIIFVAVLFWLSACLS